MQRGEIDQRGCQVKCRSKKASPKKTENQLAKGIAPKNNSCSWCQGAESLSVLVGSVADQDIKVTVEENKTIMSKLGMFVEVVFFFFKHDVISPWRFSARVT